MSSETVADALSSLVLSARSGVVFTGAGMSTESGIPDFRSPGGLWTQNRPIDFSEFMRSEEARRESWRRRFALSEAFANARPNSGHVCVASWVRAGRVKTVITQNIDELHQASGVPQSAVIELHGSTMYAKCVSCDHRYEIEDVRRRFETNDGAPRCDWCEGYIKTATISFGQPMPAAAMKRAEAATLAADVFIVLGSSLVVYPAAAFPELAKRRGAKLAIVNREPTDLDGIADVVVHDEIGKTLDRVAQRLE